MKRRKDLSTEGLLRTVSKTVRNLKISQIKGSRKEPITLHDCIMSALAMFSLKYSALLKFDKDYQEVERVRHNLKVLYNVAMAPCDTYMRERLDEIDPKLLRKIFTKIFSHLQRSKSLESFQFFKGRYIVSVDV